jgi:hypothetical protein
MLSRSVFLQNIARDPLGPAAPGGFGAAAALLSRIAEFQRQYLSQDSIVHPLAHRTVAGAGTTNTGPRDPGTLDDSIGAQRVKVEPHRRRVQSEPSRQLGRVDRPIVLAHQF